MPSRNQSGKPEHIHQNLGRKRKKSGKKYEKTIKWYVSLLVREKKEWLTKWIAKTKIKAEARIKKYGISKAQIDTAMAKQSK